MDSISIELLISLIAMIIGIASYLSAKNKENNRNGRESATVDVKLDFILNSLEELKNQFNQSKIEDEKTKDRIVDIEKDVLTNSMRIERIEKELGINHDENNKENE